MMVGKVTVKMEMEVVTPLPGVTAEMVGDKFTDEDRADFAAEMAKEMEGLAVAAGARIISVSADLAVIEV